MAERQMLQDIYSAIFGATPTTSRLDEAEQELADQGGDFHALASEWATLDTSIPSRLQTSIQESLGIDDAPSAEELDEATYFGRLVEMNYVQLFGREPGGDITSIVGSDSEILELAPDDLTAAQQTYFGEGIDLEGFQYWVGELMDGALDAGALVPVMIEGAEAFESEDQHLMALNEQGLTYLMPAEEREMMELDLPVDQRIVELDYGTWNPEYPDESGVHITPQEDDTLVHVVNRTLQEEEWTVNGSQADNVSVSISQNLDSADWVLPKLTEVDTLFVRNTPETVLLDAQDLGQLVFRDTDFSFMGGGMDAYEVNPNTALGITNVDADYIYAEFNGTAAAHNTAIRGFEGYVVLDGISSATVGTRLEIDSLQGRDLDNDIYLEADNANVLSLAGDADLALEADSGMALTRVDARQLDADLEIDVSGPGLADSSTLFHAAVLGSTGDTTVHAGDTLWKEYSSSGLPGNTLTFDGGTGHNTLTTSADGLQDFDPEYAWDDANLQSTFAIDNLHTLEVVGGNGGAGAWPGDRVDNIAAEDPDRDVADVVADYAVLDTGLFGDQLEEVVIRDAWNMHVETRDRLTEIALDNTNWVDLAAGSALEEVSLNSAWASTVFADGDSLQQINLAGSGNITLDELGTVEIEDDDGNVAEHNQVVRLDGTVGSNGTVNLNARDGVDTLSLEVTGTNFNADLNPAGEDLDTLEITNTSSVLTGSINNINLAGMNDAVTIALDGEGYQWVGVTPDASTSKLTVEGTDEGRQELYLDQGSLGGLVNGDGVEIGEHAVLYLWGDTGDAGSLDITGEGTLGLHMGTYNLFHADPGAFEVGRYVANTTLESIRSEAPVQVAGDMDTLQLGYAKQYSDDAAVVELAGDGEAIQLENLEFTDGHVRDVELLLSDIAEPEDPDAVAPAHVIGLDTEALGPDENRGNTDSIDIQGDSNLYLGLGVHANLDANGDPDGTQDRLAGLADDGTISAGDGELNAVVTNDMNANVYDEHELDLDQFTDAPDTLGFAGGVSTAETRLSDWDDAIRIYDGFSGDLTIEPAGDDVTIDLLGWTVSSRVILDSAAAGTVTVQSPDVGDLPGLLAGDTARLWQLELEGSDHLVVDAGVMENGLTIGGVHELGADATIDITGAGPADLGGQFGINQNADGGDSTLTVNADLPDPGAGGAQARHEIHALNLTEADNAVAVTLNGDQLIVGAIDASNADDSVAVTVNGEWAEVGNIDASQADTFDGSFAAGISLAGIQADEATTFDATFGDEATVGTISAGTAAGADPDGEVNLTFGADAVVDAIAAGDAEFTVAASFGDNAAVTTFDASQAEEVTLDLTSDSTIGSFDASGAETVEINFDGGGNLIQDYQVNGADVVIDSSGGGSATNTMTAGAPIRHESLVIKGDTDLSFLNDGSIRAEFEDDAVFDLTAMNANLDASIWLSGISGNGLTVDLYGTGVEGADRFFSLGGPGADDVEFDFSDMASGQRVEIEGASAGLGEIDFLFDDVAFDLDADSFLVNGFGIDDVDADDWDDVFALAADNDPDFTKIHNEEGDFELVLLGVSADELDADNFDII